MMKSEIYIVSIDVPVRYVYMRYIILVIVV